MAIKQECGWMKVASEPFHKRPIELLLKSLSFDFFDISMTFTKTRIDNTLSNRFKRVILQPLYVAEET